MTRIPPPSLPELADALADEVERRDVGKDNPLGRALVRYREAQQLVASSRPEALVKAERNPSTPSPPSQDERLLRRTYVGEQASRTAREQREGDHPEVGVYTLRLAAAEHAEHGQPEDDDVGRDDQQGERHVSASWPEQGKCQPEGEAEANDDSGGVHQSHSSSR